MPHILGDHASIVAQTASRTYPDLATPQEAHNRMLAVLQCLDLTGLMPATRPRAASPAHPAFANRVRERQDRPVPMNPVAQHHGTGEARRPPGDNDSGYWRHEYDRVASHFDRCEVVRRAGRYLGSLLERDPKAPSGELSEKDLRADIVAMGPGFPVDDVARHFKVTPRAVHLAYIEAGLHPLSGRRWRAPEHNVFAAEAAREMRAGGVASVDIARALERSANTVRAWTTCRRQAA
jgi:hypothetical protein